MEISVSCCKIWRRYFPVCLYCAGTDVWIYDDRCGVRARTHDAEKSGWCVSVLWQEEMDILRRLDQCGYPDSDRAVLFGHWRLGNQILGRVYPWKWDKACGGWIFWIIYLKRCFNGALFCYLLSFDTCNHLCRCTKRNRTCIEADDAGSRITFRGDCHLFGDKTGSHCRCEVFPGSECKEFFVDDSRSCDGADVLFAVDCHGYPDHIWFLYEEGYIH